jgi:ATP-dependent Clp protease ATP-binding subunit ClpX
MGKNLKATCDFCGNLTDKYIIISGGDANIGIKVCRNCLQDMCDHLDEHDCEDEHVDLSSTIQMVKPADIKEYLDKFVVGQEEAKKTIAVAIYNHYKRIKFNRNDIQKSNIIMIGPTGVGKTEIARTVARFLDVPFVITDATTVTEAGYVGDDVENILLRLIQVADFDIERAEHGIIYIDEIDKIARKGEGTSISRDVSGEGVQQALLKIIEGAEVDVPVTGGRKHPNSDRVRIDTSNILFICGGAFEDITMREKKNTTLGFSSDIKEIEDNNEITAKDLIKQGIIPELVGRLPIIVKLDQLTKDDLKKILTDTDNSIVKQYKDLIKLDGVNLTFSDESLDFIAGKAIQGGTGARGLKAIIEKTMNNVMYETPSDSTISKITIAVKDNEIVVRKSHHKKAI